MSVIISASWLPSPNIKADHETDIVAAAAAVTAHQTVDERDTSFRQSSAAHHIISLSI